MIRAAVSSLLLALVCLALSSRLPSPLWLRALDGVALFAAASFLFAAGAALARIRLPRWARGLPLAAVSAALALGFRGQLVLWLSPPEAVPAIDFGRVLMGSSAIVGAVFAVASGAVVLARSSGAAALVSAGAAVTAGLYVIGPVLLSAGVPLDHRTFLGLSALGFSAYAIVEAGKRLRGGATR